MNHFKVGDRVVRFKHIAPSHPQKNMQIGDTDTVIRVYDSGTGLELKRFGTGHAACCFEKAYPNPPHKHAEWIKAWADGAEIEFFNEVSKKWESAATLHWVETLEYRIKPQPQPNPNADKISEIETTISQLQQQVKELKNANI